LYCPYEVFKALVLDIVDTQCIEEPFKSTIEGMSDGSDSNDDDESDWEDWELVLLTAGVCVAVFALMTVAFLKFRAKRGDDALLYDEK
jgi:hypothetical protein